MNPNLLTHEEIEEALARDFRFQKDNWIILYYPARVTLRPYFIYKMSASGIESLSELTDRDEAISYFIEVANES